jgi:putative membrane protein
MMIGILVLIGVGVFFLARYLPKREGGGNGEENDSLGILKRRYARGEIGRDDFEAMRKTLDESS